MTMDWKLELVTVPVADQDVAKAFYVDTLGFGLIVDVQAGPDFRVIQANPPGSACAVALMRNPEAAGTLQGLHLVVNDIDRGRAEVLERGGSPGPLFRFVEGSQVEGPDPDRADYGTFFEFQDPDGNGWLVQEVGHQA
jgi:catechol 2,3-dioxygenase-like lactoylglutathione lyase family enzyme